MTAPVRDLDELLAALAPQLHEHEYGFCCVPVGSDLPARVEPFATVREVEGLSLIAPMQQLRDSGTTCEGPFRLISLCVHSSLEAVGLTAVLARALAAEGISANVVAGFHHDHLLVPAARAEDALSALQGLSGQGLRGDFHH